MSSRLTFYIMLDVRTIFSSDSILKSLSTEKNSKRMESQKLSYADVLKNSSSYLNSSLPVRLVPKAPKTRLSDEAVTKLRSFIHEKPKPTKINREKRTKVVKGTREAREESEVKPAQPLILATASDWVVPGSLMSSAIYDVKKEERSASSMKIPVILRNIQWLEWKMWLI